VLAESIDDRFDAMAAVVATGLRSADLVMVVTDAFPPVAMMAELQARGVPVPPDGQVQVVSARELYLPTGRFEPDLLYDSMAGLLARTVDAGYPGLRLVADMTWTLATPAGLRRLADYEAAVNRLLLDGQAIGVCLYDQRGLDVDLMRAVTCAHPTTTSDLQDWAPMLRVRRTRQPYGLALTGEADTSNRQAVLTALDAIADDRPASAGPIVIDVAGLRFADAATGAALRRLAERVTAGVRIIGCHGAVAVVLDRLDLAQLPGVDILPAAIDADGPASARRVPER
jgi:anti-anti-sigma regulatory factor